MGLLGVLIEGGRERVPGIDPPDDTGTGGGSGGGPIELGLRPIPTARSKVEIAPSSILDAARAATDGRHIYVRPGNIDGRVIEWPRGTAENPVVVRPADPDRPPNFRKCEMVGNGHVIWAGCLFDDRQFSNREETRALRLWGDNKSLWYCRIASHRLGVGIESRDPRNTHIYRTHWFAQNVGNSGVGASAMQLGDRTDINRDLEFLLEECLIENYLYGNGETISIKGGGVHITKLTMRNTRNIWCRHGNGAIIERVRMPGLLIRVFDKDHVIRNIIVDTVNVDRGNFSTNSTRPGAGSEYNAASNVLLQNIKGLLRVNYRPFNDGRTYGFDAFDIRWNNVDRVQVNPGGSNNQATGDTAPVESIPNYSGSQVGNAAYRRLLEAENTNNTVTTPNTGTPGVWAFTSFRPPAESRSWTMVYQDDLGGVTRDLIASRQNFRVDGLFPWRSISLSEFGGFPMYVNDVKQNQIVPPMQYSPQEVSIDATAHRYWLLRYHLVMTSFIGLAGKFHQLMLGRGYWGDGYARKSGAYWGTDGVFSCGMHPRRSGNQKNFLGGFGSYRGQNSNFGNTFNLSGSPDFPLNRIVCIDQIIDLGTGSGNGAHRVYLDGIPHGSIQNIEPKLTGPGGTLNKVWMRHRDMNGGRVENFPAVRPYKLYSGGFFIGYAN